MPYQEMLSKKNIEDLKIRYPKQDDYESAIEKIEKGYPFQYLMGFVEFYGYYISVNESVLIPRFETELLVEKVVQYSLKYLNKPKILDIGTGSGCIPIALSHELRKLQLCEISAIDISEDSIIVAKENFKKNKVSIDIQKMDILSEKPKQKYDIVISNPPYIANGEKVDIQTKFEPQNALYAKNNGLEFYERILSLNLLNEKGIIAFEIGQSQGNSIKEIAKKFYPEAKIIVEKDYTKKDRFVFIFQNCE